MEKPDLLILGLDRQALEIGLAVAALGGRAMVATQGETGLGQAIGDGEMLARLLASYDATPFETRRQALAEDIRRQRSPERLRAARMMVAEEPARFLDRRRIAIGETIIEPRRILIATGCDSAFSAGPIRPFFETGLAPERVTLRGACARRLDLASLLLAVGARVSLLNDHPAISGFDPDGLHLLLTELRKRGLEILPETADAESIWAISPPMPRLAALDTVKAGLRLKDGRLVIRHGFETTNSRIFAVGAVVHPDRPADPGAVAHLLGRMFFRQSKRFMPAPPLRLIGGSPGLAEIGLTEREALARGAVQIARTGFAEADPSDHSGGMVKLMADRRGRLLGASLFGHGVAERIAPLAMALAQGLTLAEIARVSLPPGSASEAIRLAAASPARGLLRRARLQRAFRFFRFFG